MDFSWTKKADDQTNSNYDAQAAGGANQAWTPTGGSMPGWVKAATGTEDVNGANEMARAAGLNYDAPAAVGASESGFMPSEEAFFNGAPTSEVESLASAEAAPYAASGGFGAVTGGLGLVAGGVQAYDGAKRAFGANANEQDHFHGGLDMLGGTAGVVGGGLGLAASGALGAGAVAACAPAAAIAAPVAAAIGLGVAGDHQAEAMGLWGTDKDGKEKGTMEAAWDKGTSYADGSVGGDLEAVGATTGLMAAGAVADVGLGFDALGASSGLFGTAEAYDGTIDPKTGKVATHNMGAFEAMDHAGKALGNDVDDALGIDKDSLGGEIVGGAARALTDIEAAPLALAADVGAGVVGGVEAVGGWIADVF